MRIAILEDETIHANHLKALLTAQFDTRLNIEHFTTGESLSDAYERGTANYDLLFMDIMMGGVNGVATARVIRRVDQYVPIVFVTGANATAREIYDVDAIGYIEKPMTEKSLSAVLSKIKSMTATKTLPILTIKTEQGTTHRVSLSAVTHITKDSRSTIFHRLNESPIATLQPIATFSGVIEAQMEYVSIYRSDYVNLAHVHKISRVARTIELTNGQIISIARDRVSGVMDAFTHFLGET